MKIGVSAFFVSHQYDKAVNGRLSRIGRIESEHMICDSGGVGQISRTLM
jgi:hypothetical protein